MATYFLIFLAKKNRKPQGTSCIEYSWSRHFIEQSWLLFLKNQ